MITYIKLCLKSWEFAFLEKRRTTALRKVLFFLDAIIVSASLLGAHQLHSTLRRVVPWLKGFPELREYIFIAVLVVPLWLALAHIFGLNRLFEKKWKAIETIAQLIKHHFIGFIGIVLVLFVTQTPLNRSLMALFMVCTFLSMLATRALIGLSMSYQWRHGYAQPRIVVVGDCSANLIRFVERVKAEPLAPEIVGIITPGAPDPNQKGENPNLPIIGNVDELEDILHKTPADQVLFFPPFSNPEDAPLPLRICETLGVSAQFAIQLAKPGLAIPRVISLFDHPFITFDVAPKSHETRAIKHGFDAIISFLGLIVLSPLLLLTSLAILLTMGRPVLFVQDRAGLFGRRFRMLKFRTMTVGAEHQRDDLLSQNEMSGPVFKISDDPRVTRLGRILRRTSIDELPQLFNVLLGTMSLVGPRPLPVKEQEAIYGWHRRRLSMRPGITGLWQVSGRSDIDFEDWMKLDLEYIDDWSLALDLKILFKTIGAVFSKAGAK